MGNKRAKSTPAAMVTVLTTVCLLSGALLSWLHSLTAEPVAVAEREARVGAIAEVLPAFDNDPVSDAVTVAVGGDVDSVTVYPARDNGKLAGAAVECVSQDGFSGAIRIIFGFDASGAVTGYRVMSHAETPGLGAKMEEWFRMDQGRRSVIGRNPGESPLMVSQDGGDVDGITAATITSRAFIGALQCAYEAFEQFKRE